MAEASHQTPGARPLAFPMRLGGQPPTLPIQNQASHLVHLPDSPPDAAMALVPLAPAEDSLSTVMPARAKARTFLQRSAGPSPEPREALGPYTANQSGETALLRQQLLESHSRVGTLTQYVVQAWA